jgi:hypothetical protein
MKKVISLVSSALLIGVLSANTVFAFSDVDKDQKTAIEDLQSHGIVSGIDTKHFAPQQSITMAQVVQMIVKGFGWNPHTIDKIPFASDYFTSISNDVWYAKAFIAAKQNGLPLTSDVVPSAVVTRREQFADLLNVALHEKIPLFSTKLSVIRLSDQDEINPDFVNQVQQFVVFGIVKLGDDRAFHPKQPITRGEAAVWLYNALKVVIQQETQVVQKEQITVSVEAVSPDVNKVTLSRTEKPTTGYNIVIQNISFENDGTAVITYALTDPKPDQINGQMVTYPKAETYLSSKYKPVIEWAPTEAATSAPVGNTDFELRAALDQP